MKDERLYLVHIIECIELIQEYLSGGWESYQESTLVQDAILRRLQIMGESTQRLLPATKAAFPDIPWAQIAGMRNVVTHGYLAIDDAKIRYTIEESLPVLKGVVSTILDERQAPDE